MGGADCLPSEYALFLRSADNDLAGVWLEDNRTLDYYMLRDGDALDYICKIRTLRVKLLDDTVKTLQVDEAKTVGELMMGICARIGITNYDEYGLCHDEEEETEEAKEVKEGTGTLTLKKKQAKQERDAALEQLSKKLKTDDNVQWLDLHRSLREQGIDPKETLLLKRRLYYSDRNVDSRDPVQLHLLYVQTRDTILKGTHPVTEQEAADCKLRWVNIRDVHRRILRKNLMDPANPSKSYKYENELTFMKAFYKDINITQTGQDDEKEEEDRVSNSWVDPPEEERQCSDEDLEVPKKKVKTRRKRSIKRQEPHFEEVNHTIPVFNESMTTELDATDSVDAFLLSIGATLKTFSPYHLNLAKSKIFAVVQDHDLQQIVERQRPPAEGSEIKIASSQSFYSG
ncbi:unnamed protein product [Spodoptera exigua]|nr:unnamed protein product [Spodoptera exigua]